MDDERTQESREHIISCDGEYTPVEQRVEDIQIKVEVNDVDDERCEVDSVFKSDVEVKSEHLDFASNDVGDVSGTGDIAKANRIARTTESNVHDNEDMFIDQENDETDEEKPSIFPEISLIIEPDQLQFENEPPTCSETSATHNLRQLTVALDDVLTTSPDHSKDTSVPPKALKIDSGWKCPRCDFSSESLSAVKRHMKQNKMRQTCRKGGNSLKTLIAHKDNKIKKVCTKARSVSQSINSRKPAKLKKKVWNIKNLFGLYRCPECSYTSAIKACVVRHFVCHDNGTKMYDCEICKFKSKNSTLAKHQREAHPNIYDSLRCMECSFTCQGVSTLEKHIRVRHPLAAQEQTLKAFDSKPNNCESTETQSGTSTQKARVSKCSKCNFTGSKSAVNNHRNKCRKKKTISIQSNKAIEDQSRMELKRHGSARQGLRCDSCNYQTDSAKLFATHKQFHQQQSIRDAPPADGAKKQPVNKCPLFKCQECDFQTEKRSLMQNHRSIHINTQKVKIYKYNIRVNGKNVTINMYTCSSCSYQTKSFNALVRHQMTHHQKEKNFSCDRCDFKTGYKQFLTRHTKKFHPQKVSHSKRAQNVKEGTSEISPGQSIIFVSSDSDSDRSKKRSISKVPDSPLPSKKKRRDVNLKMLYADDPFDSDSHAESDLENLLDSALTPKRQSDESSVSELERLYDPRGRGLRCQSCTYVTGTRQKFLKHVSSHGETKLYACDRCEYVSFERRAIAGHLLAHAQAYEIYLCDCGVTMKTSEKLKSHQETECASRLKVCVCGFETRSDSKMEKHKAKECPARAKPDPDPPKAPRDVEVDVVGDKFKCPACFYTAKYHTAVKTHYLRCHVGDF
ncbi:zinc finger protein 91-like [Cylas formicarius]|uniref:zinc finger protein 91-like n=1 Tax=Cylas formicarius TaxID=197179 RepID=UPI002958326E|nr:zinc finger protein 91-like [Cylas formicarius]